MMASGSGRVIGWSAFAFLAGVIVGGVAPRGELKQMEDKVEDLKTKSSRNGPGQRITDMLTGGAMQARKAEPAEDPGTKQEKPDAPAGKGVQVISDEDADDPLAGLGGEDLEAVKEGLAMRKEQARAALEQATSATPEQMVAVDAVIAQFNDHLVEVAYKIQDAVVPGEEPSRRTMLEIGREGIDAMIAAEDGLRAVFPDGGLEDDLTDPTAWIDPSVADVFADIQRQMGEEP